MRRAAEHISYCPKDVVRNALALFCCLSVDNGSRDDFTFNQKFNEAHEFTTLLPARFYVLRQLLVEQGWVIADLPVHDQVLEYTSTG